MSRVGRAPAWHFRRRVVVALVIAASLAIAACGGGGHANKAAAVKASPAQLVSQTFSSSDGINSGRVSLSVDLSLDGIKQLGGQPIALNVSGPFQRGGHSFSTDLTATVSADSSTANVGIDKVGKDVYLELAGTFYDVSPQGSTTVPLAGGSSGPSGAAGPLSGLGINVRSWLSDPHELVQTKVGGVSTDHLQAQINIANLVNDLTKLIGGTTGSTGSAGATSLLPLLQSAITKAQVDIYTGVSDHILRKFDLAIAFAVPQIAAAALDGLTGGSLTVDATLTDVNQPQTISAPANAQPSSKLLNGVFALESKFGSLASLVAGLTGSGGTGSNFGALFSSSSTSTSSSATSTPSSASSSAGSSGSTSTSTSTSSTSSSASSSSG